MRARPSLSMVAASVAAILINAVAAMGFEPMTATVRVSNGPLYDYVILGEHPSATDGFDNAYDTVSPGNLNADMGEPFISVVVTHPDWKKEAKELRGDLRSPAKRQEWKLAIRSTLKKGAPLAVALDPERGTPPQSVRLTLRAGKKEMDLRDGGKLSAPGPGKTLPVTVVAEQP